MLQTIKLSIISKDSQTAARAVENISGRQQDESLLERLSSHNRARIESRNVAYDQLVPDLLKVAQNTSSHWRYVLTATVRH